jgi:hypothetical protein
MYPMNVCMCVRMYVRSVNVCMWDVCLYAYVRVYDGVIKEP